MKRRALIAKLGQAGFYPDGGTEHERFSNGSLVVLVPRHREIPDPTAKAILKQAHIR